MTIIDVVPGGHVLRLAASYESLPQGDCSIPDRCEQRACERCQRPVHYDPAAAIPLLGPEFILCDICLEGLEP